MREQPDGQPDELIEFEPGLLKRRDQCDLDELRSALRVSTETGALRNRIRGMLTAALEADAAEFVPPDLRKRALACEELNLLELRNLAEDLQSALEPHGFA